MLQFFRLVYNALNATELTYSSSV